MAHVTELCLFSAALAEQPRIRIGCREVRVIRAFLAMKVTLGVASATACSTSRWRRVTTILGNKALHARPSLDQRPVDREVLAREQAADLRFRTLVMNLRAISPSNRRSRFLQKTVVSQTTSSIDSPTNQRNRRLYSSCSINRRSERTV